MRFTRLRLALLLSCAAAAVATVAAQTSTGAGAAPQGADPFRFKSGVELVNVTATVSDDDGHFVSGLTKDDFIVYEDGAPQEITNFSNERVPVLLQGWTYDRGAISPALSEVSAEGGTAMYDAIARARPIAADGRNQKKA